MCLVVLVFLLCWCFTDAFSDAANTRPSAIRYNMADVLALRSLPLVERANLKIPIELRARKRGKRGGVRVRNRKRGFKPFLPSAIIGNVQSLQNKLDELHACVQYHQTFRTCSMLCFTETWLHDNILDNRIVCPWTVLQCLEQTDRKKQENRKGVAYVCI